MLSILVSAWTPNDWINKLDRRISIAFIGFKVLFLRFKRIRVYLAKRNIVNLILSLAFLQRIQGFILSFLSEVFLESIRKNASVGSVEIFRILVVFQVQFRREVCTNFVEDFTIGNCPVICHFKAIAQRLSNLFLIRVLHWGIIFEFFH